MSSTENSTLAAQNVARFDSLASTWDDSPMRTEIARAVTAAISDRIEFTSDMSAMDYGCGTGLVALSLAPRVASVLAADSSEGMLAAVSDKCAELGVTNVTQTKLDLGADALPAERFDLIYTSMTLHHIADVSGLLSRFYDLLNPGGWLAVIDLDKEDGSFHGDSAGIAHFGFDRDFLDQAADEAGYQAIRISTAHVVRREQEGVAREYPLFILTARRGSGSGATTRW